MKGTWEDSFPFFLFQSSLLFFLFSFFLISWFSLIFISLFLLLCPDSGTCLSVLLPLCPPDFHPPPWTPVPGKGPQLIPMLHYSSHLVSYNAHKMSAPAQELKIGSQGRR